MDALTERQHKFVREYLLDGNATQAAIRAGYAETSATAQGSWLLRRPHVRAELDRARMHLLARRDITADRVLEEYRRLAFSDIRGLFAPDGSMRAPHEWDDETAAAVAGLEVSRTRTTTFDGDDIAKHGGTPTMSIEDSIVKVKRWDKLKALEVLAKHTGVLTQPGGTPGGTAPPPPLDPSVVARMDDTQLEQALATVRMLAPTPTHSE